MRKIYFTSAVLLSAILSACGTVTNLKYKSIDHRKRPQVERVAFNPSDIQKASGEVHLVGRVYLRDSHTNEERVGNNVDVVLNPVSSVSTQWFNEVCRKGKVLIGEVDPLYEHAMDMVKTNSYGQFAFPNVSPGEYYLSTRLYWHDTAPFSGPVEYGGLLAKKVKLVGDAVAIDLNQQDRCPGYYR
ncbi:carboxypeptidase regulatory-like domain-containing protein [Pelistega europaea]|uniref:Carboxypeptidase regulatory-like domain-containing protein n=1 Tax=Pelistega europaea TaxID=106147 RepID=A0A7Y4P669_9BURK|nr:carboxypeptidase regulatory-like domain-containing protein [Pelistega europaea]NOL49455.1 carboxypeptidase regulatory-like domain-containing protein [Pelistega europaea]